MIIWLIGMSRAGKTTVGKHLVDLWKADAPNTVLVDGDDIRRLYKHNLRPDAHTLEGRRINAERITEVCAWLDGQGINAVCSVLSLFPEMRARNHELFSGYFEVYLKVPLEELKRRDAKGLYAAAEKGEMENVVGVDIPFPEPETADLTFENHGPDTSPEAVAADIFEIAVKSRPKA